MVLVSVFDQPATGPNGVPDQSLDAMIFATSPPPSRKAWLELAVGCLSFMRQRV